jgi:hypothetical protein
MLPLLCLIHSLLPLADGRIQIKLVIQILINDCFEGIGDTLSLGSDQPIMQVDTLHIVGVILRLYQSLIYGGVGEGGSS